MKNDFYHQVQEMEDRGASADELRSLLGRGRSRRGIFEGDLVEGELEIGQVASLIDTVVPAEQVVEGMMKEYYEAVEKLNRIVF